MTNNFFQNNRSQKIILILAIIIIALGIFQAGHEVGYRKGSFSRQWSERQYRQFSESRSPFSPFMMMGQEPNPHGALGQIITKNLPRLIVQDQNKIEEVIVVDNNTLIRKFRNNASTSDLTIGANVVVFGEPNDNGEIKARLIRIMPDLTSSSTSFIPHFNNNLKK